MYQLWLIHNQQFIKGANKTLLTLHCLLGSCYILETVNDHIQELWNFLCLVAFTVTVLPRNLNLSYIRSCLGHCS